MKRRLRLAAAASLAAMFAMVLTVRSQPRANQTPGPATASAAAISVPGARIALLNTELFLDEKQGISRLVVAIADIEKEFGPKRIELQELQTRIKGVADEIAKTQTVADPNALRAKQQQGEAWQREYKFKADEAQAAYQKRVQERTGPINEDIGKVLDAFAKKRGITLILDASKLAQIGAILTANDSMDVTRDFINEYNSHSATAPPR